MEMCDRTEHSTLLLQCSGLTSLLNALIEGLQHSCIDCDDDIHRRIQLFFGHTCFPCVRKASIHSGIAEPHHRNRETDKHLFALAEAFDGVSFAVESSKVGFLHIMFLSKQKGAACCAPTNSIKKTSRRTENAKALVLGSTTKISIKCHELQTRWVILGSNNSRTYLHGIRGSKWVRLDNPFSMPADNVTGWCGILHPTDPKPQLSALVTQH